MVRTTVQILVIEDNPADVLFLREALANDPLSDFQLETVDELAAGLAALRANACDVVLLDLGLPDSQGLPTFLNLHQAFPEVPVVVLSALQDENLARLALQAGAQDYLVKSPQEILSAARAVRYAIERHKSEQRFFTIFLSSPIPEILTSVESGRILDVNPAYCRMVGYAREELLGRTTLELRLWLSPEERAEMLAELRENGHVRDREIRFRHSSGGLRLQLTSVEPIELHGERYILSTAQDITERKQAEEKLRQSEANLREAQRVAKMGSWRYNLKSDRSIWSEEMYHLFEMDPANFDGTYEAFIRRILPEDVPLVSNSDQRTWDTGLPFTHEYRILTPGSGLKYIHEEGFTTRDAEGTVTGLFGVAQDITERKLAEEQLRQRVEDLALINTLNTAVNRGAGFVEITDILSAETRRLFGCRSATFFLLSPDKKTLHQMRETLAEGYKEKVEGLIGMAIPKIDIPLRAGSHFARALASDEGILIHGADAVRAWLADFTSSSSIAMEKQREIGQNIAAVTAMLGIQAIIAIPLVSEDEVVGVVEFVKEGDFDDSALARLQVLRRQLTEIIVRKRIEESLHESREKYRILSEELEARVKERTAEVQDLYDSAPAGYHSLDASGRYVAVNLTEAKWLGFEREDLLGKPVRQFLTSASLATFKETFATLMERGWVRDVEVEMIRKDGSTFPVLVSSTAIFDAADNYVMSRSTVYDNSERRKAEQVLRESEAQLRASRDQLSLANASLEKALRAKDEFLATMSHELRTPLSGVLSLSESLQEGTYGPLDGRQGQVLDRIQESGRHLLELINDILDVSKAESGNLELAREEINLSEVVEAALRTVNPLAARKRLRLYTSQESNLGRLNSDPRRLRQMLINLLFNALKFTPEAGKVGLEVSGDPAGEAIRFTVWDTGIGIPREKLALLFQPFVQLDSSLARLYDGTGLGLTLVRKLAELHGGSVGVESEEGQGSRFWFSLPVHANGAGAEPSDAVSQAAVLAVAAPPARRPEAGGVILYAEDNSVNYGVYHDFLSARGYIVLPATNGYEAIDQACLHHPGLILMDIQMPAMDGLEAIRRLREMPEFFHTPIIALTALAMKGDEERCMAAGADSYLAKPLSLKRLIDEVERLLEGSPKAA